MTHLPIGRDEGIGLFTARYKLFVIFGVVLLVSTLLVFFFTYSICNSRHWQFRRISAAAAVACGL